MGSVSLTAIRARRSAIGIMRADAVAVAMSLASLSLKDPSRKTKSRPRCTSFPVPNSEPTNAGRMNDVLISKVGSAWVPFRWTAPAYDMVSSSMAVMNTSLNCSSRIEELRSCLEFRLHRSRFGVDTKDLKAQQFGTWRKRTAAFDHIPKQSDCSSCTHLMLRLHNSFRQFKTATRSRYFVDRIMNAESDPRRVRVLQLVVRGRSARCHRRVMPPRMPLEQSNAWKAASQPKPYFANAPGFLR